MNPNRLDVRLFSTILPNFVLIVYYLFTPLSDCLLPHPILVVLLLRSPFWSLWGAGSPFTRPADRTHSGTTFSMAVSLRSLLNGRESVWNEKSNGHWRGCYDTYRMATLPFPFHLVASCGLFIKQHSQLIRLGCTPFSAPFLRRIVPFLVVLLCDKVSNDSWWLSATLLFSLEISAPRTHPNHSREPREPEPSLGCT